MSKPVLFVTGLGKDLKRAENMNVLYEAYPGEKKYMSVHENWVGAVLSKEYDLMVMDIFPTMKPKKCIMVWHAIQGGKYIGLDENGTYYREQYANLIDAIVVAGKGGIDMFHQCTKVPKERILNLGMPRTDRYFDKEQIAEQKQKMDEANPLLKGKRIYLFAPTFRTANETPMPCIDWQMIDEALTDDEAMVVKPHPQGHDFDVGNRKHIYVADKMKPSVNWLYYSDVIITDYSSIMFDAYLLNKPVVLFEKNPGYCKTRGMYMKYPDAYCSRFATDEAEMIELMKSAKRLRKTEKDCRDYVADMCDGHSCERIIKLIDEMNG